MEDCASSDQNGGFLWLPIVIIVIFIAAQVAAVPVSADPSPPGLAQVHGTRAVYELNIEVDYFEGLLLPEVIDAFAFLESYFEARDITASVDFNSTNNVIAGNPYISDAEWRAVHRQYHDRPATHIHFIIAKYADGYCGLANPVMGAIINLELTEYHNETRHVVMHEIGHCIGIGLHDDSDTNETYASSGFMAWYSNSLQEYLPEDWESAFAPDGAYGNQTWKTARIWNRYSVYGELFDDTADVTGVVISDIRAVIYLKSIDGITEYAANIEHYSGIFSFQPKPGNYTLEVSDGYRLVEPVFVNVTERAVINLGDVAIVLLPVEPPEPLEPLQDNRAMYMLAAISVAAILVMAFAVWARKNDRGRELANKKILAAAAIAAVIIAPLLVHYWSQNDIYSAMTVNELYNDMVDRNGDGTIGEEDIPLAWHSYSAGDSIVVRDRIESIWYWPSENETWISLGAYSGVYGYPMPINLYVSGNATGTYSEGDIIFVKNHMVEYNENIYPEFNAWTIIG